MSGIDSLWKVIRGEQVSPKPSIDLRNGELVTSVLNPFGCAVARGIGLNAEHSSSPEHGEEVLAEFVDETRKAIARAVSKAAPVIAYVLVGASPDHCTPMQYGGLYLEKDRELLSLTQTNSANRPDPADMSSKQPLLILYVAGGEGTYLDIAADLPAGIFAWDAKETGVSAQELRRYRQGALCANDPDADVLLAAPILTSTNLEAAHA